MSACGAEKVAPIPGVVYAEKCYLEQMRRIFIKILVIPESVAARRVRESVVINKYCIIYCHDRSPTETLGDDGKRQQLIQEHSTKKPPD